MTQTSQTLLTLSGEEIYHMIMEKIEPELLKENQETVRATYANETPEDQKNRMKRYKNAFDEYERQYKIFTEQKATQLKSATRKLYKSAEKRVGKQEESHLTEVEDMILAA